MNPKFGGLTVANRFFAKTLTALYEFKNCLNPCHANEKKPIPSH
jgi:hypothetical protein